MPGRLIPEDGDIVVREQRQNNSVVYTLHTAPGADQYQLRARAQALAQAVAFARRARVRAWLTDEGYDFMLLEDFRV
jgi:hypothetical protein